MRPPNRRASSLSIKSIAEPDSELSARIWLKAKGPADLVVREVLAATKKAGLGEVAFGGREHLVAWRPAHGKDSLGVMAYMLRYAEELRDGGTVFFKIKASKIYAEQLQLAKELIRRNSAEFDPKKYKDDYEAALREVIDAKLRRKPLPRGPVPHKAEVIRLADTLRRSSSEKGGEAHARATSEWQ